jgi:hypothetical protein
LQLHGAVTLVIDLGPANCWVPPPAMKHRYLIIVSYADRPQLDCSNDHKNLQADLVAVMKAAGSILFCYIESDFDPGPCLVLAD